MSEHQQMQQSKESKPTFQKQAAITSQNSVLHPASIIQRARINPKSLTPADILQLQRTIGNRAVGRLLSEIKNPSMVQQVPIQRQIVPEEEKEPLQGMFGKEYEEETCPSCTQRLKIQEEEEPLQDKFETIQRLEPEDEEKLQMKSVVQRQEIPEKEEPIQGKMIGTVQRQEIPEEEETLQGKMIENNTGMPDNLKAGVENLSGIDMSDVRVHYNSSKPAEVGALAYTQGTNIHVAPGQEIHLPHETWHVVQQMEGRVKPTMQANGVSINDDATLEREADVMGAKAFQITCSDQVAMNSTSRTSISLQRRKRVSSPFPSPMTEKNPLNFRSPQNRKHPQPNTKVTQRSQNVIQRNAQELGEWVTQQGDLGDGHSFVDASGLVVINDSLDVSDAFWKGLLRSQLDVTNLKNYIRASKALKDKDQNLNAISGDLKTVVTNAQKSSGGRMRFRVAIGPTMGGIDTGTSEVEKFVKSEIAPLYGGVDRLPDWITNMDALARQRLYDLPNANNSKDHFKDALKWAIDYGANSVPQLVNYTEYYQVSKGLVDEDIERRTAQQLDTEKNSMTIEDTDPRLVDKKLELAKDKILNDLTRLYGRYFGRASKPGGLDQTAIGEIAAQPHNGQTLNGIAVGTNKVQLLNAMRDMAETLAHTEDLAQYTQQAKDELKKIDTLPRLPEVKTEKEKEVKDELANKLFREMNVVTREKFAGNIVSVDNFWAKSEQKQKDAIKSKANDGPIPFTADHSAAYHALKHYQELDKTVDRTENEDGRLLAYLNSCRETVKTSNDIELKQGQMFDHPSFFFKRTIPAAPLPFHGGQPKDMRAIVVVSNTNEIKIASYFEAS